MAEGVVISERRLDWITAFARNGANADRLEDRALRWLGDAIGAGDKTGILGFQGFHGEGTAHIFAGRRSDGVLVRLGGEDASLHYRDVLADANHVSRIDLCVTVFDPTASINPAHDVWELGQAEDPDDAKMPTVTRTEERWGGYTTYLGRRASAVMARIYNKHKESKGAYANGSWRFELELKRHASEQEAIQLAGNPEREDDTPAILSEQFRRWGVLVPWSAMSSVELWRTPPRNRDLDQTARRLGAQYRKVAQRYVDRYGVDRFLELFGLTYENDD